MIKRQYHYLVSGLPGISVGERLWASLADFRSHLEVHLHQEDFTQVKHVLLQQDHQNLLHFLQTGEIPAGTAGNYTVEDFRNPDDHITGAVREADPMPVYMSEVLVKHTSEKEDVNIPRIQQELDEGFFSHIMAHGNDFLRNYYTFSYDLDNLLSYIKTGFHKLDQLEFLTGSTPHTQHLREYAGRTLVKDPDLENFDEILSISESPSFAEQEKKTDQLCWRVIDEMNLFEYFSIDRILGYLLQMRIAERWSKLDRETGEKQLRHLIDISYRKLADEQRVQQAATE